MRHKIRVISIILAVLTVILLFFSYLRSNFFAGLLKALTPVASGLHLSSLFKGDADFYSYLANGIVLSFIDYKTNNLMYIILVILAIALIFVLDATVLGDNEEGKYDRFFVAMSLGGTALFGVDFVFAVILFLAFSMFRSR